MVKKLALLMAIVTVFSVCSVCSVSAAATEEWALNYSYSYQGFYGASDEGVTENATENKLFPIDESVKYKDKASMRVNIQGTFSWWCAFTMVSGLDLSQYKDKGCLQFAIKGEKGGEEIGVGFADNGSPQVNASMRVTAEKDWKIVVLPIQDMYDQFPFFLLNNVNAFLVMGVNNNALKVWIADVRVLPTTPNVPKPASSAAPASSASGQTAVSSKATGSEVTQSTTESTASSAESNTAPSRAVSSRKVSSKPVSGDPENDGLGVWVFVLGGVVLLLIAAAVFVILKFRKKPGEMSE